MEVAENRGAPLSATALIPRGEGVNCRTEHYRPRDPVSFEGIFDVAFSSIMMASANVTQLGRECVSGGIEFKIRIYNKVAFLTFIPDLHLSTQAFVKASRNRIQPRIILSLNKD